MTRRADTQPGDRVRYWTLQDGLTPQMGTLVRLASCYGSWQGEISPDDTPRSHIYLMRDGTAWRFEPLHEEERNNAPAQ